MAKSYEERQAAKADRFVASLTGESEFVGLVGAGYPGSFYKVFVRETKDAKRWWRFEGSASPSTTHPIKHQASLPVSGRVATVWAPLPFLADYRHHPDRKAIAKLLARAVELRKEAT